MCAFRLLRFVGASLFAGTAILGWAGRTVAQKVDVPAVNGGEITVGIGETVQPDTLIRGASISESSSQAEYAAILKSAFTKLYANDVRARLIVENAFAGGLGGGGEEGLAIVLRGNAYFVVAAASKRWLWRYTEFGKDQAEQYKIKLFRGGYHQVPIVWCSAPLDPAFGVKVADLWQKVVIEASFHHFDRPPADDTRLEFSAMTSHGMAAGSTYGSFKGTKVSALMSTAGALYDYCKTKRRAALVHARKASDQLDAALIDRK